MNQLPRVASFVAPKPSAELTDEDDEEFLRVTALMVVIATPRHSAQ
jgi:hypothetical protein